MHNYFGFITLMLGLYCIWLLDSKIQYYNLLITDFVETEITDARSNILPLDIFRIKRAYLDSTTNLIFDLYEQIPDSPPYSNVERKTLLKLLNYDENAFENTPNIFLLNELLRKKRTEKGSKIEKPEYALVIDDIKPTQNDSLEISVIPIRVVKNNLEIEYYYKGELIASDYLSTFGGEVSELKAKVTNPATGEIGVISGK